MLENFLTWLIGPNWPMILMATLFLMPIIVLLISMFKTRNRYY